MTGMSTNEKDGSTKEDITIPFREAFLYVDYFPNGYVTTGDGPVIFYDWLVDGKWNGNHRYVKL